MIVATLVAASAIAIACTGGAGGTSESPTVARRPNNEISSSSGSGVVTGSSASSSSSGAPSLVAGCPSMRNTDEPLPELSEALLREHFVGVFAACGGPTAIEIRIDPDTDRLVSYNLDNRYVRNGTTGWIEVEACRGDTCMVYWHLDGQPAGLDSTAEDIRIWTDPVALTLASGSEWVRVAE